MPIREPEADCALCPRLVEFRRTNRSALPSYFNAPVPAFGSADSALLIVGLAPGLKGANCTGRPFTGDFAGDLLYGTLLRFSFAEGTYGRSAQDGLKLVNCRITNAVRCVPPANKPTGQEIAACRPFLTAEINAMPHLRAILALGRVAHESVLTALGCRRARYPFQHGKHHDLPADRRLVLADSYHCSRYNTNTGRLTEEMFSTVIGSLREVIRQ